MTVILDSTSVTNVLTPTTASSDETTEDMEVFLNLLLTQLENQDPLDPVDTTEYTNQLVLYSTLEQVMILNDNTINQTGIIESDSYSAMANYVGKQLEIESDTSALQNGEVAWSIDVGDSLSDADVVVTNESGDTVYRGTVSAEAGVYEFVLSADDLGDAAAEGEALTLEISGTNSAGETVTVDINALVTIESIDTSGKDSEQPLLRAGDLGFDQNLIVKVTQPEATADADETDEPEEEIAA